ncbi:MAG: nucleotidyltransferase domain-containing protein [Planctomycetota bacterium]|nr:nucleotidyltransferase domain-containing protein [Planctomycetota bacterium]
MGIRELLHEKREEILALAARYGARNVRVFGSVARGTATAESDIDFLVTFDPSSSLMDHAALLAALEELLKRKVDVAPDDCLRPRVRARVLQEAVAL